MAAPEYLICLDCETPCYDFEWHRDKVTEILCAVCGNEDVDRFVTGEDFDSMEGESMQQHS